MEAEWARFYHALESRVAALEKPQSGPGSPQWDALAQLGRVRDVLACKDGERTEDAARALVAQRDGAVAELTQRKVSLESALRPLGCRDGERIEDFVRRLVRDHDRAWTRVHELEAEQGKFLEAAGVRDRADPLGWILAIRENRDAFARENGDLRRLAESRQVRIELLEERVAQIRKAVDPGGAK